MNYLIVLGLPAGIFATVFLLWLFLNRQRKEYCYGLILLNLMIMVGYLSLLYLLIPLLPQLQILLFFGLAGLIHSIAFGILIFRDFFKMLQL